MVCYAMGAACVLAARLLFPEGSKGFDTSSASALVSSAWRCFIHCGLVARTQQVTSILSLIFPPTRWLSVSVAQIERHGEKIRRLAGTERAAIACGSISMHRALAPADDIDVPNDSL